MRSKRGNFYGIIVLVIIFITIFGIITSEHETTGFAVKQSTCFDGTLPGECSFVKPRYCDDGALKFDCKRCGCNVNEMCQDDGRCLLKCGDETPFGYCSKNKPFLCFKGSLEANCFECGCFPGQICLSNGSCSGNIKVGAGAEEKKETIKEPTEEIIVEQCIDGSGFGQCSFEKPKYCVDGNLVDNCEMCGCNVGGICSESFCLKKSDAGFWWNLFCKVLYFNEYDDCISDAIRYKTETNKYSKA